MKEKTSQIKSFRYAFSGIFDLIKSQNHFRFHLFAAFCVTAAGFFFRVSMTEWAVLVLTFALVFTTEALNTAIEYSLDAVHPDNHPLIKRAKDIAAGAVLITAIGSIIVGLLIFIPHFL